MKRFALFYSFVLMGCGPSALIAMPKKTHQAKSARAVAPENGYIGFIFSEDCGNIEKLTIALRSEKIIPFIFTHTKGSQFPRERFIRAAHALQKIATENKQNPALFESAANSLYTLVSRFDDFYEENPVDGALLSSISRAELKDTGDFLEAMIPLWNKNAQSGKSIPKKQINTVIQLFKKVITYKLSDTLCDDLLKKAMNVDSLKNFIASGQCTQYTDYRAFSFSPELLSALYDRQYRRIMQDEKRLPEKKKLFRELIKSQMGDELDGLAALSNRSDVDYITVAKSAYENLAISHILKTAYDLNDHEPFLAINTYCAQQKEKESTALKELILKIIPEPEIAIKRRLIKAFIPGKLTAPKTEALADYRMNVWQEALERIKGNTHKKPCEESHSHYFNTIALQLITADKLTRNPFIAAIEKGKQEKTIPSPGTLISFYTKLQPWMVRWYGK
jgi:hypothetical protein